MKKIILFLLLAMTGSAVWAQDYCKQIKKEVTENNTNYAYETPYKEDSLPPVRAVRSYSTNPEADFDNFNVILAIPCEFSDLLVKGANGETEKEESGIVVEFDDKSKLEEDITVTHEKKGDGTAMRIAYLPVNGDNIKDFTAKKIVRIHLATAVLAVPDSQAIAMQKYMTCLKDVHKM